MNPIGKIINKYSFLLILYSFAQLWISLQIFPALLSGACKEDNLSCHLVLPDPKDICSYNSENISRKELCTTNHCQFSNNKECQCAKLSSSKANGININQEIDKILVHSVIIPSLQSGWTLKIKKSQKAMSQPVSIYHPPEISLV